MEKLERQHRNRWMKLWVLLDLGKTADLAGESLNLVGEARLIYGAFHPEIARAIEFLARAHFEICNYDESIRSLAEAMEIYLQIGPTGRTCYANCLAGQANCYMRLNKDSHAGQLLADAGRIFEESGFGESKSTRQAELKGVGKDVVLYA